MSDHFGDEDVVDAFGDSLGPPRAYREHQDSPAECLDAMPVGQKIKLRNDPSRADYLFIGRDRRLQHFYVLTPEKVLRRGPSFMMVENDRLDVEHYWNLTYGN
jgi:hypothetical protein